MDLIKVVEMEPYGNRIPAYYSIGINLPQNRTARKTLTKGIPIYRKVLLCSYYHAGTGGLISQKNPQKCDDSLN